MGMNTFRNHRWERRGRWGPWDWRGAAVEPEQAGGSPLPSAPAASPPWNPQAAVYWRRRIVALMIGLAILTLIVWAFTGAIGGGGSGPAAGAGPERQAGGQQQELGGGQHGAGPGAVTSSQATTAHKHGHTARAGQPASCRHGSVVLSLFTAQESYGTGQLPQFSVNVVGTGRQTCTFNVGASHVALIIRSGSVRVWNSADCVQGAGELVTDLQRGVPTVLPISWNRRESSPGCAGAASRMPAGTYTATAADGWLTSNTVSFRIG